jgi:hypothetical protein
MQVPMGEETEKEISPLSGKEMRKHEKSGVKGLTKEQKVLFWEQAIYWCNERFSEAKWREVVRSIERATKEDNLIVFGWHPPLQPMDSVTTKGGRQILSYDSSSLTSPTGPHPLRPAHLPRIATLSPTSARPRWDIMASGPPTPLSATSGPVKNAFAEGGVWASLSPKTTGSVVSASSTPITAVPVGLRTPDAPSDPEAKAAYDEVRREIKSMALQLCASRLALRRSSTGQHDVIHPSMVKPKDELRACEVVLESYDLDLSLHIDPTLPEKIDQSADDEAACLRHYRITSAEKLAQVDSWLLVDEQTSEVTNVLEAQRELLRVQSERRRSRDSTLLTEQAVQCAWATKILCDAESIMESRADAESAESDEDEGYDYENFVRSLRSASSSFTLGRESVGKGVDADGVNGGAEEEEEEEVYGEESSQTGTSFCRSGSSPPVEHAPTPSSDLPLRTHDGTTNTTTSFTHRPTRHHRNLSIKTCSITPAQSSPLLTPEERGVRRQGPSIQDLCEWADELKKMERKRTELRLTGNITYEGDDVHPALQSADTTPSGRNMQGEGRGSRRASGTSSVSWKCETASLVEQPGDGMVVRRCDDDGNGGEEDAGYEEEEEEEEEEASTPRPNMCSARTSLRISPPRRLSSTACESRRGDEQIENQGIPCGGERDHIHRLARASSVISLDRRVSRQSREEQEEWVRELERMEMREKMRQAGGYM